ncbi:MAG: hypothetical protein LBS92_00760 [Candidatus Methanoplasma sp.]|jgi:glucose/mannose-6-phosphate isomerase|nr:hypothetical protein [Candidatus Methanoplasma sp.]
MTKETYDFLDGLERALTGRMDLKAKFDRILFCGMGGSADSGEIIRGCVIGDVGVPISIWRFPELPSWVDRETMVIISSYSGKTWETASMYSQAKHIGCPIIVLTAGEGLERQGTDDGFPVFKLDPGIQPRNALGVSLSHLAKIMDSLCGTGCVRDISRILPSLRTHRKELAHGGEALGLAQEVGDRTPMIYATSGLYAASIRWKNQINENAKTMAFAGSVSEFGRDGVGKRAQGGFGARCAPLLLCEASAAEAVRETAYKHEAPGQYVKVVCVDGETPLERTVRAVMTGDYLSLYLAQCKGVDPMDIGAINMFKQRMLANSRGESI